MNCRQAERWILLLRSGELPSRKRMRLERHVCVCPRCATYREDVDRIMAEAKQSLPSGQPGVDSLAAIRNAARAEIPGKRETRSVVGSLVFVAWRPLLAFAAAVLICVAGWYMLAGRSSPWPGMRVVEALPLDLEDKPPLSTPDPLYELTIMMMEDDVCFERASDLASRPDVSLADRELMILEGLAI